MSITLERLTEDTIYIAAEMMNSNPSYNTMEYGKETVTDAEIAQEFLQSDTESFLIKLDDTYIGMTEYLQKNKKDGHFWIGFFLIHRDYQGYSFGTQAYSVLEESIRSMGVTTIRLAVLVANERGRKFWENQSYTCYGKAISSKKHDVYCLEKVFV